jgi:putative ABC transport system permease protein
MVMIKDCHPLLGDIQFTFRSMRKAPGFFLIAMLAIVLGISSTTTVFSLINAVLIRSLPYSDPKSLSYIWSPLREVVGVEKEIAPFETDVMAMQNANRSFTNITAVQRYIAYIRGIQAFRIGAARVLGNFFQTMESHVELGRVLDPDDDQPGKQFVAVISDALWRSRFGGDPNIIGKTIRIDRNNYRLAPILFT